jgi:hypothetical protein
VTHLEAKLVETAVHKQQSIVLSEVKRLAGGDVNTFCPFWVDAGKNR